MALIGAALMGSAALANTEKPTIVLVHGAFADGSSWNGVIDILEKDGYKVVAVANPLRSLKGDAEYVGSAVAGMESSVVLVGHSYGGAVITEAAGGHPNVKALVYVAAFAPDVGETALQLAAKFPGSTLGAALAEPVQLSGGDKDLYIQQDKFHSQFAADVSAAEAKRMAAAQRPVTERALSEAATSAAWKETPAWYVYGAMDKNIPAQLSAFMADRLHAKQTVVVKGGSHALMVSNPVAVASLIESAAKAP